ncbi:hypothetical protein M408DRAFT_30306 [Serendipita vermifera MAFF 305830]|uniref:Uncharacterized protein n=1 Tax=Serendipita vermifera MAFF 305830 TaxID=933852 RepID=A0A0C3AKF0_SERVB|nr:hypothetical protein M408DRAFT_30306 [Serendipita vermifera MAFF 305830]
MVIWKKDTVLHPILLPSLQNLDIISPMSHWILFSFEEDTWLGLFSIVDYLSAPYIEKLTLRGSLQRTLAVVAKGNMNMCPSELSLYILSLDQAINGPVMGVNPAWHRLNCARLDIRFDNKTMFSHQSFAEARPVFDAILSFLPKTCLVCIETQSDVPFPLGLAETVYIEYDDYFGPDNGWSKDEIAAMNMVRLFVADIALSRGYVMWSTFAFIEHVTAVDRCLKTTFYDLLESELQDDIKYTRLFAELEYLRCFPEEVVTAVSVFKMRNLRVLYIESEDWSYNDAKTTYQCIMEHAEDLPRLTTLHFESPPIYWKLLIDFVGSFNKSSRGGGITTLKLPTQPHHIVWELKAALNSRPEGYVTDYLDRGKSEYEELEVCWVCFENGWVCAGKKWCTRSSTGPTVSITKDTDWHGIDWYASILRDHYLTAFD